MAGALLCRPGLWAEQWCSGTERVGLAAKGGKDPPISAWEHPKLHNHPRRETYFSPVKKMYECQKASCIFLNT